MRRQLVLAARRGVDVRILTTEKTDSAPAQWAARAFYGELIANGVRVFEYVPRLLHAKILLVDNDWGSIGTANFDYRSLFINYEIILISENGALNRQLRSDYLRDLQDANEIVDTDWRRRGLLGYLQDRLGLLLRKWL